MAINLDDRSSVVALDPKGILGLTEGFGNQCREAYAIARAASLPTLASAPKLVVLTGMGGSASGGDFVRAIFEAEGHVPFVVNRDYTMPSFLGKGDLVFVTSYSGNTEETLSAYADAKAAGAEIIAVTSGGKLKELADKDGFHTIIVPGGQPPRTALGYMMIPVLVSVERLGLVGTQPFEAAFDLLDKLKVELTVEGSNRLGKDLALAMHGKIVLLYGLGAWQGLIANRWRCQINENSKSLAFVNVFPELNHNEIIGWGLAGQKNSGPYVALTLQDGTESAKMKTRLSVTKSLVGDSATFIDVFALGSTLLEKLLSLATIVDFASVYLARLNEVDPEAIIAIDKLKEELGKIS